MRLLCLMLAAGCSGLIEKDDPPPPKAVSGPGTMTGPIPALPPPSSEPRPGEPPPPFACTPGAIDPGPSPLRRLTQEEYLNTVRDIFGSIPDLATVFPPEDRPSAFGLVQPDVSQVELENFQGGADVVARAVTTSATGLATVAPCGAADDKRGCARLFLQRQGPRIYRAPLDAADFERHLALYDLGARSGGHARGIEVLLRGMLQSPRFLYRVELGTTERVGPNAVKLSGWEIAARLSYGLWSTIPDTRLADASAKGELATRAGVAAQLTRMLADPRGARTMRTFLEKWSQLGDLGDTVKDGKLFPQWGSGLRTAMRSQATSFFDHVLGKQEGRLDALLTSPTVFVPRALNDFYGVTGMDPMTTLERTDGSASGLLTLTALLTIQSKPQESWPIYRGKFVREELLCQMLPPPPDDMEIKPPDAKPGQSRRERFVAHSTIPACSGCHRMIDPIGFSFETHDALGRHRLEEGGKAIDTSGELIGTDTDGRFADVPALGKRLAASVQVHACATRQWFRHALGRFEQETDGCTMKGIYDAFRAAKLGLGALPLATVQSDAFLHRRPLPEVLR